MDKHPSEVYKVWHFVHKKEYDIDSEEGLKRYENFRKNHELVLKHNSDPTKSYKLGLNHFADHTVHEFREKLLAGNVEAFKSKKQNNEYYKFAEFWSLPEEDDEAFFELYLNNNKPKRHMLSSINLENVNWIEKANIKYIEDQEECGSCWAFATAQAVQAEYYLKKGKTLRFSKQQLVDCETESKGCSGGSLDGALEYIKKNGIVTESDYPYKAEQKQCAFNRDKVVTKIASWEGCVQDDKPDSKDKCQTAEGLYSQLIKGPVATNVDASEEFMLYESGIYDKECKEGNHAVLLVGYHKKETESDESYWVIKNSWGTLWGENGFGKIKHSTDYNNCLLHTYYARPNID